jgi:ABC-type dipeptide/oligopeptide/nickel transport systems, permease components
VEVLRDLLRYDRRFLIGFIITVLVLLVFPLSLLSPYEPTARRVVPTNLPPSWEYPLGTNALGQDIAWNLIFAVRNTLIIGLLSALLSRMIATFNGLISGYIGGVTDRVLSTITDSLIVLPRLPILVFLSFVMRGQLSIWGIALILAFLDWAWPSKRYRSQVLSLREREFTETALFSGMSTFSVVTREHLPFLVPYIMADVISGFIWAMGMEITLSVLGLTSLSIPTIGTMIYWANYYQAILRGIWWWIGPPVVVAIATVIAFYLLSVSLSEFLDPRTRLQRIKVRPEMG